MFVIVNFLSHYYLDRPENPYLLLGIILPDIEKDFSKYTNEYFLHIDVETLENEAVINIINGLKRHYWVDKVFHNSDLFLQQVDLLKKMMEQNQQIAKIPRISFVAHILYELILDNQIIEKDDTIIEEFYIKLDKCNQNTINECFTDYKKRELDIQKIITKFDNFKKYRYLENYRDTKNLGTALEKIFEGILPIKFDDESKNQLKMIAEQFKSENDFQIIFNEVKQKLE